MCVSLPVLPQGHGPQDVLVINSHNVAFGPLLPFPPLFLGNMVSHPAETARPSLLQICRVLGIAGGEG